MARISVIGTLADFDKSAASKACGAPADLASARVRRFTIILDTISSLGELTEGVIGCVDVFARSVEPAEAAVAMAMIKATVAVLLGKVWRIIGIFKDFPFGK